MRGISIDERANQLAHYIIETKDTVRGTAKRFRHLQEYSTQRHNTSERLEIKTSYS